MKTKIDTGEHKGYATLTITQLDDEGNPKAFVRPFSFGVTKAKMIIENIEVIKEFIEASDK